MPKACPYVIVFTLLFMLWCLRYGVVEFVEFRANGAHYLYNIKKKQVPFGGGTCFVGYVWGLRLIWWRVCSRRLR